MRKFFIALLLLISAVCIGVSVFFLINPEPEGQKRQEIEESLADAYLAHLEVKDGERGGITEVVPSSADAEADETESGGSSELSEEETEADYDDTNYYTRDGVTYTPDYARGRIIGVLEIPTAKIRRGIYGGTKEDIEYDLDIWMVTEARPEYVLGETHFCIYGHNHTVQDLSFNNLKNVKIGDTFTITNEDGVWVYDVTDFFAEWRETVARDYVDNFSLPKDKCYIFTCGRDEYRYKDIVVVGTLRSNPKEPEAEEDESEEQASAAESTDAPTEPLLASSFKLSYENEKLTVSLVGPGEEPLGARMALVDGDGLFVEEWDEPVHTIGTQLPYNTEYLISVFSDDSMPEGYSTPKEVVFNLKAGGSFHEEQLSPNQSDVPTWAVYTIAGLIVVLVIMLFALVAALRRK